MPPFEIGSKLMQLNSTSVCVTRSRDYISKNRKNFKLSAFDFDNDIDDDVDE